MTPLFHLGLSLLPQVGAEPAGCRPDPEDRPDVISPAENAIVQACQEADVTGVRFDDEAIGTADGEYVEFELPRVFVRVKRNQHPSLMAVWCLEEASLALRAASRRAAVMEGGR